MASFIFKNAKKYFLKYAQKFCLIRYNSKKVKRNIY